MTEDAPGSRKIWVEGTGESEDDPVVIHGARNDLVATFVEFEWLAQVFGQKDVDWTLVFQAHGYRGSRSSDTVRLRLRDGREHTVYFDNTEGFGKWDGL